MIVRIKKTSHMTDFYYLKTIYKYKGFLLKGKAACAFKHLYKMLFERESLISLTRLNLYNKNEGHDSAQEFGLILYICFFQEGKSESQLVIINYHLIII